MKKQSDLKNKCKFDDLGIMEMLSLDNICSHTRAVKGLLQIYPQNTTNYWVLQQQFRRISTWFLVFLRINQERSYWKLELKIIYISWLKCYNHKKNNWNSFPTFTNVYISSGVTFGHKTAKISWHMLDRILGELHENSIWEPHRVCWTFSTNSHKTILLTCIFHFRLTFSTHWLKPIFVNLFVFLLAFHYFFYFISLKDVSNIFHIKIWD